MKRLAAILLITVLLFSATSCGFVSDKLDKLYTPDENAESTVADPSLHRFISQDERNGWRDNLISVLSQCDIYDSDLGILGSFAAGLMDLDFDNTPEVILAYAGGSMGNVSLEIYDLNTGAKLDYYNASHWDGGDNIYLCVAKTNESYVVLSQGSIRIIGADFMYSMGIIKADRDSNENYLQVKNLFATWNENEEKFYSLGGENVNKTDYDKYLEQFSIDYKTIDETQIQLIKWSTLGKLEWKDFGYKEGVDPESKTALAEKMANALINSSQEFIEYDIIDNAESNEEPTDNQENENTETKIKSELSEKYPDVPKVFESILDAYVEIASLNRYEGLHDRKDIDTGKYPNVTAIQLDCIFNSLMDGWLNGAYGYYAGYATKDINGDGINELFLTDVEYSIYAMFTLVNGETVSHYFDFSSHENVTRIDANGNFYRSDYEKGESEWYEISRLGADGTIYGTTFGHHDMTGFGDPEVYNYYYASEIDIPNSFIEFPKVDGNRLTEEEYNDLVAAYRETVKKLNVNASNSHEDGIGLEFHQVITEDQRK